MNIDWSVVVESLPALIDGAGVTLYIAALGLVGGTAVGLVVGLARAYAPRVINAVAFAYVEVIRGTPIVVQVMFLYFALPIATDIRIDPMSAATGAIIINAGAYIAEVVRGAFLSVPNGLREAGLAMGLPTWKVLALVVGPVAARRLVPPLGNQFIVSLKDTSLFIVIGVGELTRTGQEIMATNFKAVEIWATVAVLYLIMTGTLSGVLRLIERKARIL